MTQSTAYRDPYVCTPERRAKVEQWLPIVRDTEDADVIRKAVGEIYESMKMTWDRPPFEKLQMQRLVHISLRNEEDIRKSGDDPAWPPLMKSFVVALLSNPCVPSDFLFTYDTTQYYTDLVSKHPLLPIYLDNSDPSLLEQVRIYYKSNHYPFRLVFYAIDRPPQPRLIEFFSDFIREIYPENPLPDIPRIGCSKKTKAGQAPTKADEKIWLAEMKAWMRQVIDFDEENSRPRVFSPSEKEDIASWFTYLAFQYLTNLDYKTMRRDSSRDFSAQMSSELARYFIDIKDPSLLSGVVQYVQILKRVGEITGTRLTTHLLSAILDG